MGGNILICVTDKSVFKKHISWSYWEYSDSDGEHIALYEVVENSYKHPDAPDLAVIQQVDLERTGDYKVTDIKAAPILLLKNALDNCSLIFKE